jgi:uncharacterized protein
MPVKRILRQKCDSQPQLCCISGILGLYSWPDRKSVESTCGTTEQTGKQIDYIELPAMNITTTQEFYTTVFGWKFEDYGPAYTNFSDGRLSGGFSTDYKTPSTSMLVVIYASDLAAIQTKIVAAGGAITRETFSFPGGKRFHFADPNGNELAVWSDAP